MQVLTGHTRVTYVAENCCIVTVTEYQYYAIPN